MKPIVKFVITKARISSTLHTAVRYGPQSLGGIRIFYPFVIQRTVIIAFIIKHYCQSTPSSLLIWDNLSTLQLEAVRGGRILEKIYTETQQWLQTES